MTPRRIAGTAALLLLAASGLAGTRAAAQSTDGTAAPDTSASGGAAADSASAADSAAVADSAAAAPARTLLSSDGSIYVYEELRPGEGINGFYWVYDAPADLDRLLDEDRRGQTLEKLTDAFGFQIFAPESILALRDSVTAVADSILGTRLDVKTRFDPKLTSRYSENRDTFDFVNEFTTPVPLSWGTLTTSITNGNNFNESTNKIRDDRTVSSGFTRKFGPVSSSLTFNRTGTEQHRGDVLESRSNSTSVTARALGERTLEGIGTFGTDVGLTAGKDNYATEITDGEANKVTPSWGANFKRPVSAGNVSLDYRGTAGRVRRAEDRIETVPGEGGEPDTVIRASETDDRNLNNNIQLAADTKAWDLLTVRLNGSLLRDKTQYIAQEDSVAGRQETRRNSQDDAGLVLEGKPWTGLEVKLNGRAARSGFEYELEPGKFNRTNSVNSDAEVRWTATESSAWIVRMSRGREDRNSRNSQAGIVDKESANLNWQQDLTGNVDFTANYDVSLDSFVFDDKVANTGDRDLRNQRGIFTINYTVSKDLSTSIKMDVRKNDIVNTDAQKARENKSDYAYIITPTYSLRLGPNSVTGELGADARYAVYDFDEDSNFLTRRFSTRQRWQRSLTEKISSDVLGTYEVSDEGAYRPGADGIRRFARSREVHRFRVETQMLYNPRAGFQVRALFRRDGDNQYNVTDGDKRDSGRFRTDEFTVGASGKRTFQRTILLDFDASYTRKQGDRVTDVDRKFFTIRLSLEYRPFKPRKAAGEGGGS